MSQYDALLAQFALVTKQFVDLKAKFVGLSKEKGPKGDKGDKGDSGKTGSKGDAGDTGPAPEHKWRGTKLQFQHPDGSWGDLVDLKGKEGKGGTSFAGVSSQTITTGSAGNPLVGPQLTYNIAGQLVRVDYDDGRYKTLQYTGAVLTSVTFFDTGVARQRTLNYVEGQLISVDEVLLP
jgi:hypothetical protein